VPVEHVHWKRVFHPDAGAQEGRSLLQQEPHVCGSRRVEPEADGQA
jgi:hypothetical protein